MSSDPPGPPPPAEPADPAELGSRPHHFRRLVAVVIGALLLTAAGLTAANARQAPRLVGAEVNLAATVVRTAQKLTLRTDQAVVVAPDQVRVTPAVPVEVTSTSTAIVLRLGAVLHYRTAYEVEVPVRSTVTGVSTTLSYTLQTPDAEVYLLERAGTGGLTGPDDEVVRNILGSTEPPAVHHGRRTQEFAVSEPYLATVTQDSDDAATLSIGPLDGSAPAKTVADGAAFSQLKSSGPGGLFGFVMSRSGAEELSPRLQLVDPVTGVLTVIKGFDGFPLAPQEWAFVPGTRSLVAQIEDSSFYLVNPFTDAPPIPLGGHIKMYGFDGGTRLVVQDLGRYTVIDLATGKTSNLPTVELTGDASLYSYLSPPGRTDKVGLLVRLSADGSLQYSVVKVDGTKAEPLFAPKVTDDWIDRICLSPNGDYLAVETVPAGSEHDDYSPAPGYQNMVTVVIDSLTGQRMGEFPGFGSSWCS